VKRKRDGGLQIHLHARAAKQRQLVSVFLNEHRLGDIAMPTTAWSTYSIGAPASAVREGENKLRFYFRHTGEVEGKRTAAAIARIAVGRAAAADPGAGLVAEAATHGGKRMESLRVTGPSRLSYYLAVPMRQPQLLLAAAGQGAKLSVQVAGTRSGGAATVWQGTASQGWREARIGLSGYAGDVVRIDLVSSAAVDWGRPQLLDAASGSSGDAASDRHDAVAARRPLADHVLVWVVSALRADRLANPELPTPAFARLAGRGLRFRSALAVSPSPGPAHVALLTGRYAATGRIPAERKTLAERFREAGYTTALISGNGFVTDAAGFAQGFDIYANPMRRRHPHGARILWQKARRVLADNADRRTFIYLATVEPHLPYTPTAESLAAEWDGPAARFEPAATAQLSSDVREGKERLTEEERRYIEALYDAEVRDANAAFAIMLADLEKMQLAERTAIILVGDHGEELWERGHFGHGNHLYQEVLHVPLVVAPAGSQLGRDVDLDVELVDVYATALDLAGISVDPQSQGRSLLPLADLKSPQGHASLRTPAQAHLPGWGRALKLGRYKLVVPLRGPHQLYDLDSDPGETENLMGTRPLVERYLRNVFGIGVAYQEVWSRRRWGAPNSVNAAFAADQGL
jgi:arylsulfatase A-like enzyme